MTLTAPPPLPTARTTAGGVGRTLALLAAAGLVVAAFLPWTAEGTPALWLGLGSLGARASQPTVALALVALAAAAALPALVGDAGWPRLLTAVAGGGLIVTWVGAGPDGAMTSGVVTTIAAVATLLVAAALATGSSPGPPPGRRGDAARGGSRPRAPAGGETDPQSAEGPLGSGFEVLPHTADTAFAAWGPTRAACFAQAVRALVASFAETTEVPAEGRHAIALAPGADDDILVDLLDEVIYLLDVRGLVPVRADLHDGEDGGLVGELVLAPVAAVRPAGAVPKAITYHRLEVEQRPHGWRCRVTVDV
ncbi:MAG TPA: archease [Nitriliruptorales bacterium]|nr:archease [Nitriliruptorales bacterium]